MSKTATITLYSFAELSADVQAKLIQRESENAEYFYADENLASLNEFAKWFGVTIRDYNLGGSDNRSQGVKFECRHDGEGLKGVRLWKWLNNQFILPDLTGDCPFTGYSFDETLLDGIREFMERPTEGTSYRTLIGDCIESFCQAYASDVDYCHSAEAARETLENDDRLYTKSGKVFDE